MKLILLVCIIGLVLGSKLPGYIIDHSNNGSMKAKTNQNSYTQKSFTDLLKYNFQVLSNSNYAQELIEEFGKGNLLNPVSLNYMFVVEGSENQKIHPDNARVEIEQSATAQKILDEIFSASQSGFETLKDLTSLYFPQEKRTPFYFYKSQILSEKQQQQSLEKFFGIELKRDPTTNQVFFQDSTNEKQIGSKFSLQNCIKKNFPEYIISQDKIYKQGSSSLVLEIDETNAREVESLLKDVCAVAQLSSMFQESKTPNFVVFALKYADLENNLLVQDLVKSMYDLAAQNFQKNFGFEKIFGQILYVNDFEEVLSKVDNETVSFQPRILAEVTADDDDDDDQLETGLSSHQFRFWFGLCFCVVLYFVCYSLLTMDVGRDTLLYAKFIVADAR